MNVLSNQILKKNFSGVNSFQVAVYFSCLGHNKITIVVFCKTTPIPNIISWQAIRESILMWPCISFVHRFSDDIEYMTGRRPNLFWKICWMFITPAAMLAILIASIILMSQGKASYYAWNEGKVWKPKSLIDYFDDFKALLSSGWDRYWFRELPGLSSLLCTFNNFVDDYMIQSSFFLFLSVEGNQAIILFWF